MYCPNCGKQIADKSRFCGYCGEALAQAYFYLHRQRRKALIAGIVSVLVGLYTLSVFLYYDQFAATDYFGKWIYPAAVVVSFLFSLNWEKLRKQ